MRDVAHTSLSVSSLLDTKIWQQAWCRGNKLSCKDIPEIICSLHSCTHTTSYQCENRLALLYDWLTVSQCSLDSALWKLQIYMWADWTGLNWWHDTDKTCCWYWKCKLLVAESSVLLAFQFLVLKWKTTGVATSLSDEAFQLVALIQTSCNAMCVRVKGKNKMHFP